ncbi:MAG: hypothetical protein B5M51_04200 [Anaerolinea sp. 4484_236]|nr:MAG: hypothetical protein B5M51_04200 [Anaerolinea sp. 4484_236]
MCFKNGEGIVVFYRFILLNPLPPQEKGGYYSRMEQKDIIPRIGTFFIVIGIGFTILFVISDIANAISFNYFFTGLLLGGIGLYFRRNTEKPPSSGRFEAWKKILSKEKKEKKD